MLRQNGQNHLIVTDQMDSKGNIASKLKNYFPASMRDNLNVIRSYNGKPIQKDGINCGPISLEMIDNLDENICKEIVRSKNTDCYVDACRQITGETARVSVYKKIIHSINALSAKMTDLGDELHQRQLPRQSN